ncbi:hypothetical protein [Arenimonas fontis]|uniref:Uncharacterized protein n=1 Tax=Arenimonas fontis TaxID=2608255 RepID=A0A5B2Z7Y7_9GAMM|nr:hypothetical protein [Arenimonas fontis]KAA2284007.1 hypothetical protein F0415_11485 [Arenimonas fontis]
MARTKFRQQVLHTAGGELAVAASYLLAWLFAPWLPDGVLLALVVAVLLQLWFPAALLGAVTPRGFRGVFWCVFGHLAVFALMAYVASAGGRVMPDWWSLALAQGPLLLRNLLRLSRPAHEKPVYWLEALGPLLLIIPAVLGGIVLDLLLPDLGLAGREIRFEHYAPLETGHLKFALMAGCSYFATYAVARTAWERWLGRR